MIVFNEDFWVLQSFVKHKSSSKQLHVEFQNEQYD